MEFCSRLTFARGETFLELLEKLTNSKLGERKKINEINSNKSRRGWQTWANVDNKWHMVDEMMNDSRPNDDSTCTTI